MVMIRLARFGKKNDAKFRVIVSDKQKDTFGPYLESLGVYDPHGQPSVFTVNAERLKHWMGLGAQLSDTVHNLCITHKLISGEKRNMLHKKEKQEPAPATATAKPAEAPKAETVKEEKSEPAKPAAAERVRQFILINYAFNPLLLVATVTEEDFIP